jgi:hypothetical protein
MLHLLDLTVDFLEAVVTGERERALVAAVDRGRRIRAPELTDVRDRDADELAADALPASSGQDARSYRAATLRL